MPSSGSSSGATNRGRSPERIEPVDDRRVDVALDDDAVAAVREREADRVVAAGGAVDQEPAAPRAPGVGGEPLGELEGRPRWIRADVDPLDPRGDVEAQGRLADRLTEGGIGSRPALVPRHVEAPRIAIGVSDQRVEVRSLVLIHAEDVIPGSAPVERRRTPNGGGARVRPNDGGSGKRR